MNEPNAPIAPPLPEPSLGGPGQSFFAPITRMRWVVGLLMAYAVVEILHGIYHATVIGIIHRARQGKTIPHGFGRTIDNIERGLNVGTLVIYAAAGVLFCCWFYRVVKNAKVLDPGYKDSAGLAAGSFFIPIYCLYGPCGHALFAWRTSAAKCERGSGRVRSAAPVSFWWAAWIVTVFGSYAVFLTSAIAKDAKVRNDGIEIAQIVALGHVCLSLTAVLLCVNMVLKLTRMQRDIAMNPADAPPPQAIDQVPVLTA